VFLAVLQLVPSTLSELWHGDDRRIAARAIAQLIGDRRPVGFSCPIGEALCQFAFAPEGAYGANRISDDGSGTGDVCRVTVQLPCPVSGAGASISLGIVSPTTILSEIPLGVMNSKQGPSLRPNPLSP